MTGQQKHSKALYITLWIAQILLAAGLMFGAIMKLFLPIQKLAAIWPWTGQIPLAFVKVTGIIDLLGTIGITLPALLHRKPGLTFITALAILALMICAALFHIARGEGALIAPNIMFALLAAFVAWGRKRSQV